MLCLIFVRAMCVATIFVYFRYLYISEICIFSLLMAMRVAHSSESPRMYRRVG